MLKNTKAPGWLAMVKAGATSVWETYDGFDKDGHPKGSSMNHYSPGAVCSFLFEKILGIKVDGKNHFLIKPVCSDLLTYAKGSYDSPFGKVSSSWKMEDGEIIYEFDIPSNCKASIIIDGKTHEVKAGSYSYRIGENDIN